MKIDSDELHVSCGAFGIYAGALNPAGDKWKGKKNVTDEAIEAVRDHLIKEAEEQGETSTGYIWDMANGGRVRLVLEMIE